MCQRCGRKPEAYSGRKYCYDCKRGNEGRPWPCRRCGSPDDFWAAGLCRRCHQYAPQLPEPCRDCYAWGARRTEKWLCKACLGWRHWQSRLGRCVNCRRELAVNEHSACRLCWTQAKRVQEPGVPIDVIIGNRNGQQLMLANMSSSKNGYRPHPRPPRPKCSGLADDAEVNDVDPAQMDLFTPRPFENSVRSYGFGDPPNEAIAERLDQLTTEHATRHGWSHYQVITASTALRVLLAMRGSSMPIQATEVTALIGLDLPARPVMDILREADLLDDDRAAPIQVYFEHRIHGLPEPMIHELRAWFTVQHHGSATPPRSKPRTFNTIKSRLHWALPILRGWARHGHRSLREITREDVLAVVPASGTPRAGIGGALRSIFTTLKAHKVTFINPTARMNMGNYTRPIPLPADTDQVRAVLNSGDLTSAALAAMVVFHGLLPAQLCALQCNDIHDGRLHLGNRVVPLADPVKQRLQRYLAYRDQRWPDSSNPHLFLHYLNAGSTRPTSSEWVNKRIGMSPMALRQDRIIDETIATSGDMRRVCDFFGVVMATAQHYSTVLNHPGLAEPHPHSQH